MGFWVHRGFSLLVTYAPPEYKKNWLAINSQSTKQLTHSTTARHRPHALVTCLAAAEVWSSAAGDCDMPP